jgi:hypothetical protein
MVPTMGALLRVGLYTGPGYWPPINIFGRLARGRLIIPSYDQVFVAPVAASIVGVMTALYNLTQTQFPVGVISAAGLAGSLLILLIGGPGLYAWRLTAETRISPIQGTGASQSTGKPSERPVGQTIYIQVG